MSATKHLGSYATTQLIRRARRSIPWIGGALALFALGSAIRRKGWVGGTLHTALDFLPYVGAVKNVAEVRRGRDFFPDRPRTAAGDSTSVR